MKVDVNYPQGFFSVSKKKVKFKIILKSEIGSRVISLQMSYIYRYVYYYVRVRKSIYV